MTCAQALESLLLADPPELTGDGTSPLAQHVRECDRCRRVAGQVLEDTQLLASAAPLVRPQRVRRRQWAPVFVMPAALAAAIVAIAVLRVRDTDTRENVVSLAPVTVHGPVVQPSADILADSRPVTPHIGRAFPAPVPVAPVRIEQPATAVVEAPVSVVQAVVVAPGPGMRAAVLHTSDPKLVVVWLF